MVASWLGVELEARAEHRVAGGLAADQLGRGLLSRRYGATSSLAVPVPMVRSAESSIIETISLSRAWNSAHARAMLRSMSKSSMSATPTSFAENLAQRRLAPAGRPPGLVSPWEVDAAGIRPAERR